MVVKLCGHFFQHFTRDIMAGEIQEPFNLSLLENSIHSGSVSFGRFEKESLSWEKRSSFSRNIYLEEAEMFSKPGSVTQMRAHFEAHFKKKGVRFPTSVEAQTWGKVEKDESLWETTSQYSLYSDEQEKNPFGDSCVSYDKILVNSNDEHRRNDYSVERTLEGKEETSSSENRSTKSLKNVEKKAIPNTSAASKSYVVITKGSQSCNTKTNFDSKREKDLKPKRTTAKFVASKAPTESLTPLVATNKFRTKIDAATRESIITTKGFSFRSNERAEKRKEEKVEAVTPNSLSFKAIPMPKSIKARPRTASTAQSKKRDDVQQHLSKEASCDRSKANGTVNSKLNTLKQIQKSLNGILPIKAVTRLRETTARQSV